MNDNLFDLTDAKIAAGMYVGAGGYEGPGVYEHYKGGKYQVEGLACREELKNKAGADAAVVVYRPLSPGSNLEGTDYTFWTRSLADFNMLVNPPDQSVTLPRFRRVVAAPQIKLGRLLRGAVREPLDEAKAKLESIHGTALYQELSTVAESVELLLQATEEILGALLYTLDE